MDPHTVAMTNTTDSTPLPTDTPAEPAGGGLAADDPRRLFAEAVRLAGATIAAVPPDRLGDPTPCAEYDVLTLGRHLIAVLRRVAAIGAGEHWTTTAQVAEDVAADDLAAAWTDAAHQVQAVWSDPAILEQVLEFPFGSLPGAVAMAVYTAEVTVHTWDLATATGQQPAWDPEVVEVALASVTMGVPAEGRGPEMPFDPVVEVPADAPAIDRTVAWLGRRP